MITKLKRRPRPDDLVTQQRKTTNQAGRMIYLGLLGVFALAMLNFLFGDMVFLRADGQVVRDRTTIAATYLSRVQTIDVETGQNVKSGEPVLLVQSAEMLERLADLSAASARLAAKAAEFKIRSETVRRLLPIAEQRAKETEKVLSQFDKLSQENLVTSARYDEALEARYEAQEAVVRLQAENETLAEEIAALETARSAMPPRRLRTCAVTMRKARSAPRWKARSEPPCLQPAMSTVRASRCCRSIRARLTCWLTCRDAICSRSAPV